MSVLQLDDHYAPNWLQHFSENGDLVGGVRLQVECAICGTELAVLSPADEEHERYFRGEYDLSHLSPPQVNNRHTTARRSSMFPQDVHQ
ncbi:hypothetical protein GGR56DRAFT_668716 [Xylariaceae sp. FL0804]|nr:hypothetical protein GGR56DRAFT_668716 [Xylariaceae sp. FL0804]